MNLHLSVETLCSAQVKALAGAASDSKPFQRQDTQEKDRRWILKWIGRLLSKQLKPHR
ncbi:MAG: hypothetical protein IK141_01150 [Clostridia bacterium]|nr:hypothetical protein [Clostridia bacterium]